MRGGQAGGGRGGYQVGPLERAVREKVDAVRERDGATRDAVAAAVDDRLDGAVDLGEGHLKRDLEGGRGGQDSGVGCSTCMGGARVESVRSAGRV